jgi:SpoVK/Ycf46/Vps4 family AAA+-type ATPase
MAAEVVAREVGLSLLKVDLSAAVSKYIGETEKNLARIFAVAQSTNAVIFFDEADALFGKRTEISDAHDRYANIETSYLLQRLDEHDGMVLLATNLRANVDAAFTRRISYVVDFPFPDAADRRRIWDSHLPAAAPIGDDLDLDWLADEFDVAGGSIKNIILNSAFLAAARGDPIGADHVLCGARREFEKLGKLWSWQPTNRAGQR